MNPLLASSPSISSTSQSSPGSTLNLMVMGESSSLPSLSAAHHRTIKSRRVSGGNSTSPPVTKNFGLMLRDLFALLPRCQLVVIQLFFFFKQKTAYEIRLSLVGSEMCIRDSFSTAPRPGMLFSVGVSRRLA